MWCPGWNDGTKKTEKIWIKYGLYLLMMCQYNFNDFNKCTTPKQDGNYGGTWVQVTYELSGLSSQFFCKSEKILISFFKIL